LINNTVKTIVQCRIYSYHQRLSFSCFLNNGARPVLGNTFNRLPPRFQAQKRGVFYCPNYTIKTTNSMNLHEHSVFFHNGKFVKAGEIGIDLYSQSLHYGYGVFEGIRAYHTHLGPRIFKARAHYERLLQSCELLHIPFKYSVEDLMKASYKLLEINGLKNAYLRPLVYCGPNMALQAPTKSHLMIGAFEWEKYLGDKLLHLCLSPYQRPNPHSTRMEAKASGHYVNSILAATYARHKGYHDGLMLDMNGYLAEASIANIFLEKDGQLITPALGHILPGITRATVLEIAAELGIPTQQRLIKPEEVVGADSLFLCGTAVEIAGAATFEGKPFAKEWKDSLGAVIQEAYQARVLEKTFSYTII
jgi:branched-chain amino acid aminotransferase